MNHCFSSMLLRKCGRVFAGSVWFGCAVYVFRQNFYEFVRLMGPSMEPTLHDGDVAIAERISPLDLRRGDLVLLKAPHDPRSHVVKRLTGLPGDVKRRGLIFTEVPKGHMWIEGDNSSNSKDSKNYGPVPLGLTKGRLLYRIWPPHDIGSLVR